MGTWKSGPFKDEVAAWLHAARSWTRLHHVEFLSEERTRALLRAGGEIHDEVKPFGVTPLSIAQDLSGLMLAQAAVIARLCPAPLIL